MKKFPSQKRHTHRDTSWQAGAKWYDKKVGNDGHYFHQHIVIPSVLHALQFEKGDALLDLACGQGVLARKIPQDVFYQGVDLSADLISQAKKRDQQSNHSFLRADITKPLHFHRRFTHATVILAIQNVEFPEKVFQNISGLLQKNGTAVVVMNHPCFRIPRQSSWGVDEQKKTQYRRIDRYLSPLKIPITVHPGQKKSAVLWSFHHSLSEYSQFLSKAGFVIEQINEFSSDKQSVGKAAKMENRSRAEIPMFLLIKAKKI